MKGQNISDEEVMGCHVIIFESKSLTFSLENEL